jgi:hypothetical protein
MGENHGQGHFAGFAISCQLASCTPDYGISGAQSKIEIPSMIGGVCMIHCDF